MSPRYIAPRYIDANKFKTKMEYYLPCDRYIALRVLKSIKTADVRENVHGEWIKNEDRAGWHCSCCGVDDFYAYLWDRIAKYELQDKYCPNCGAEMKGEDDVQ